MNLCGTKLKIFSLSLLFLGLGIFWATTPVKADILDSDVMYYYQFEDSNGTSTTDYFASSTKTLSKAEYNGDTITRTTGKFDYGASYNNTEQSNGAGFVNYDDTGFSEKTTGEFALSIWYKTNSTKNTMDYFSSGNNVNYRIDNRYNTNSILSFYDGASWRDNNLAQYFVRDNAWHHIVVQGTWGELSTDSQIYFDGELVRSNFGTDQLPDDSGSWFGIGCETGNGVPNNGFSGILDEAAMFNRKLTENEITALQTVSLATLLDPPTNNYILYYGPELSYTPINSNFNLPIVYDFCDGYDPLHDYAISLYKSNGTLIEGMGMAFNNCSGIYTFDRPSGDNELLEYGTYFAIEGSGTSTINVIGNGPYLLSVYNPVIQGTYIVPDFSYLQLIDTYPSEGSYNLPFHYNVCNDLEFASGDKIYLNNQDNNGLTAFYEELTTCSGTSTIKINYAKNFYWYFNANLVYENSHNLITVQSEPFLIGFSPLSQPYNASTTSYILSSAHDLACTEQEWEIGYQDKYSLMNVKCHTLEAILNISFTISDIPATAAQSMINILKGMFPFNIPNQVLLSWQNSTSSLPTALTYFDIADENGNYNIVMPAEWSPTGTTTSYTVFGPSVIADPATPAKSFFDGIKAFSTHIIWFAFIAFLIKFTINIKNKITGEDDDGDAHLVGVTLNGSGQVSSAQYKPNK